MTGQPNPQRAEALQLLADGMSPADVARQLGVRAGTVRVWKTRSRHKPAKTVAPFVILPELDEEPEEPSVDLSTAGLEAFHVELIDQLTVGLGVAIKRGQSAAVPPIVRQLTENRKALDELRAESVEPPAANPWDDMTRQEMGEHIEAYYRDEAPEYIVSCVERGIRARRSQADDE